MVVLIVLIVIIIICDSCEYQRIRFEVLRYQALSYVSVTWFKEELDILNNLESLRAYGALNDLLKLKLKSDSRKVNIASTALESGVKNSMEYRLLLNPGGADVADLHHINIYYSVFNSPNHLPDSLDDLAKLIRKDLDLIQVNDLVLFELICNKFFKGNRQVSVYLNKLGGTDQVKFNRLLERYNAIYAFLGDWRSNSMVSSIEGLLHP